MLFKNALNRALAHWLSDPKFSFNMIFQNNKNLLYAGSTTNLNLTVSLNFIKIQFSTAAPNIDNFFLMSNYKILRTLLKGKGIYFIKNINNGMIYEIRHLPSNRP